MTLLDELKGMPVNRKKLREFGLLVGGVILLIGGLLLWKGKASSSYFLIAGMALLLGGIGSPFILKPFYVVWMGFALCMGFVMSKVLLSVLFFLVVTPISFMGKLTGTVFLDLKYRDNKHSYWHKKKKNEDLESYTKQY